MEEDKNQPEEPVELFCASCKKKIADDNMEALSANGKYFCGVQCLPRMARKFQ